MKTFMMHDQQQHNSLGTTYTFTARHIYKV